MRRLLLAAAAMSVAAGAHAAVGYAGGTYSQDFDSLGIGQVSWTNNSTIPGWYAYQAGIDAAPPALLAPLAPGTSSSSNSKGQWYNFGVDADRSLGAGVATNIVGSSPQIPMGTTQYGVALTNNSGVAINEFTLSFDWETWFTADISVDQNLRVHYSTNATSLASGDYNEIAAALLTYTSAAVGGTQVWLGAPVVYSRTDLNVTGIEWAPGTNLWLRWTDINEGGGDLGTGIDNVSFSAVVIPEPTSLSLLALAGAALIRRRRA